MTLRPAFLSSRFSVDIVEGFSAEGIVGYHASLDCSLEDNVPRATSYPTLALAICALLSLAACGNNFGFPGVYRINVEQGNVVTDEMVEQLRPGLNRRQVRYIMGTPLVEDAFHSDRWDYRYLLRNGNETLSTTQLTLWFDGDELIRAEGPDAPTWGEPQSEESDSEAVASED